MSRLAKSLADTISEVNGAFIHTRMVTQAMVVNIVSTHEDVAQRVGSPKHMLLIDVEYDTELMSAF